MTDTPNASDFRMAEKTAITLLCPECGHENSELVAHLRQRYKYACRGSGCSYVFTFDDDKYGPLIQKFAELCDVFDAATDKAK